MKIAEGLGIAGDSLSGLLTTISDRQTAEARAQAEFEINQMTGDQIQELVSSGAIDAWEDPRRQAAFQVLAGSRLGHDRMRRIIAGYAEIGDPASVNIDQFIADGFAQDADLSANPDFLRGYTQATRGLADRLRLGHDEALNEQLQEASEANLFGSWAGEARTGLIERRDPELVAQSIMDGRGAFAAILGIEGPQQADTMMALAEQMVFEGLPGANEFATALLTTPLDGTGPVSNIRRFRTRWRALQERMATSSNFQRQVESIGAVAQLQDQAANGRVDVAELDRLRDEDVISEAQYLSIRQTNERSLIRQEREHEIRLDRIDVQGEVDTGIMAALVSGEYSSVLPEDTRRVVNEGTQREFVFEYESQSAMDAHASEVLIDQILDLQGITDDGQRAAGTTWLYANNGIINRRWQREMAAAYQAIPTDADGEIPESIGQSLQLFNSIYTVSPGYAEHLVEDRQMFQFFNGYRVFVTSGYTHDQAVNLTLQSTFNRLAGLHVPAAEIEDEIRRHLDDVPNAGQVIREIAPLANFIFQTGHTSTEEAVEGAIQSFEDRYVIMNGAYVPVNDRTLPRDFVRLANVALLRFAAENGLTMDDLYITPLGVDGQRWNIMRNDALIPIPLNDSAITIGQMRGWQAEYSEDRLTELDELISQRHDRWDVRLQNEMLDRLNIFPGAAGFGQPYNPGPTFQDFISNGGRQ